MTYFTLRSSLGIVASCAIAATSLMAVSANAATVELTYTAPLVASGNVFGVADGDVSDLTARIVFREGATGVNYAPGSEGWGQNVYGYDLDDLVSVDVTFGTKSWDSSDLVLRIAGPVSRHFIFLDALIGFGLPTQIWLLARDGEGTASVGGGLGLPSGSVLDNSPGVSDMLGNGFTRWPLGFDTSAPADIRVSAVPLPASLPILLAGLCGLGVFFRRSKAEPRVQTV